MSSNDSSKNSRTYKEFNKTVGEVLDEIFQNHTIPIPEVFFSDKTNYIFTHCGFCGKNLMGSDDYYSIQKAYIRKQGTKDLQMVFEFACCEDCDEKYGKSLSKESKERKNEILS